MSQVASSLFDIVRGKRATGIEDLLPKLRLYLPEPQVEEINQAYLFGAQAHEGQRRLSGEPYISHPVAVASILADLRMDHRTIEAAILHDVIEDTPTLKEELLTRFGLTEAATRRVSTYSGGMRRRLDLAMSLVGTPPILFLDEPTTGLDPEARLEVWKVVKELADGGRTVFLTTQYLDEAEQLADHIAILHEGKILASGTLVELQKLFPPAQVEYVEKQPTLEEIFLAIIGKKEEQ